MTVKLVANNTPPPLSSEAQNVSYLTAVIQIRGGAENFQNDPLGVLIMDYFRKQVSGDVLNVSVVALSHDDEMKRAELIQEAVHQIDDPTTLLETIDVILHCADTRRIKMN